MTRTATDIWSEEAGPEDGPLVAIVHGSMDRSAGMLRLSRRLDGHYRVLRYDRRGYGRSHPHPGPFEMDGQVADLVELLAGRRAVLVGHSYGGNVALATAARHPDLVAGVVVYESPLSWMPWWPSTTARTLADAEEVGPGETAERFMRRLIGDRRWEELPERTRQVRRDEGTALIGELRDLRTREPWTAERLPLPVAVGVGERGAPHHRDGMSRLAALLPDATLVELAGAGHGAPVTHADDMVDRLVLPLLVRVAGEWTPTR